MNGLRVHKIYGLITQQIKTTDDEHVFDSVLDMIGEHGIRLARGGVDTHDSFVARRIKILAE